MMMMISLILACGLGLAVRQRSPGLALEPRGVAALWRGAGVIGRLLLQLLLLLLLQLLLLLIIT